MKKIFFILIMFLYFKSHAQFNMFHTMLSAPRCANVTRSSCLAHYNARCRTDGYYSIKPNSTTYIVQCDMTNGGWTPIAAGGSSCGTSNFIQKTAGSTIDPLNTVSYTSTCGWMSEPDVKTIANTSSIVRLRVGSTPSSYSEVTSSGSNTLTALRTSTNWHNGASAEFSGWSWSLSCASGATLWPDMYQSCGNGSGVHWMIFAGAYVYHSNTSAPVGYSSTWIR